MWFDDSGLLAPDERAHLEATLRRFGSLQEVVRWAFSLEPPRDVANVVVQDEFSHDVVVSWREPVHLAFDTT